MIYGTIDPGPNKASGGRTGFNPGRVLQEVAIKAKADAGTAAKEATVAAIKKLANQSTPGGAKLPNVSASASSPGLAAKWSALPTWIRWTAYAVAGLAVMKAAAPSGD